MMAPVKKKWKDYARALHINTFNMYNNQTLCDSRREYVCILAYFVFD